MLSYFKASVYRLLTRFARDEKQLLLSRTQLLDARHHNSGETEHINRLIAICDDEIKRRAMRSMSSQDAAHYHEAVVRTTESLAQNRSAVQGVGRALFGEDWRRQYMPFGAHDPIVDHEGSVTTKEAGEYLVFHLLEGHFGLDTSSMARHLPEAVRADVVSYVPYFLVWLCIADIRLRHSQEAAADVMEAILAKLMQLNDFEPGMGDEGVRGVRILFDALDRAASKDASTLNGEELPFELDAAFALLLTAPESSTVYSMVKTSQLALDFGELLEEARNQVDPLLVSLAEQLVVAA